METDLKQKEQKFSLASIRELFRNGNRITKML